jgi:HAD superfamily hydrolase (TIGR01509 family)
VNRSFSTRTLDRPIAGLLFDLDGTLVDSESLHFQSTAAVCSKRGATLTRGDFDMYAGWAELASWISLGQRFGIQGDPTKLASERTEALLALLNRNVVVAPGARELLVWARRRGLPMAVASSLPRAQIDGILKAADLADFFTAKLSGHDDVSEGRSKPAPDVYLAAAAALGVVARACVAFEDSLTGMKSARAAGSFVVAIACTGDPEADCPDADCICPTLSDALTFLQRSLR